MPTSAPRTSSFDDFLARALQNTETRAAYEDSQARHRVIDTLIRFRNRLGFTQTEVARHMGVKQPSVSGFETEGSDPRLSTLQRYARAVDATLWVHVTPNASSCQRMEFYREQEERISAHAQRSEVTERAVSWAGSHRRYSRHLHAVPDSLPA
jgi:transcriptional regulator with XRE-family HTH domain